MPGPAGVRPRGVANCKFDAGPGWTGGLLGHTHTPWVHPLPNPVHALPAGHHLGPAGQGETNPLNYQITRLKLQFLHKVAAILHRCS